MRVENTRTPQTVLMQHAAGFHSSDEHLLAQLVALVAAAAHRGEPVALAVRPATERALQDALGELPKTVHLGPPDDAVGGSGQTLAAQRARELRALTAASGPVTMVSEHWSRFDGADGSFWTELDAAVNVAFSDLPVAVTCFFPELPLHQEILDGARRNHPLLLVAGELRHNPDHRPPHAVLAQRPAPAPVLLGPPDMRMNFGAWQLNDVRAVVETTMLRANYPRTRAEDVVLAVNEVATNAVEHGTSEAQLCVWISVDGLVCEVHDGGSLADPLPGLQAPHPSDPRGRGVWIARQLCDSLHVWADAAGTHVRIRAAP